MRYLVTGSSGHLGEALMRTLQAAGMDVLGLDLIPGPFTSAVGTIADRAFVARHVPGRNVILHAATLHKPHVTTHSRQAFVDTNITGTLNLLEESAANNVRSFVYTSTTSVFGDALTPAKGVPAAWITESVTPIPMNIYGVTKSAAEDLCQLFARNHKLPCLVLRTSRFFPEPDDNPASRDSFPDNNLKVNEFLYRRVDVEDVVSAHLLAAQRAPDLGFDKFIISATTPFLPEDAAQLGTNAPATLRRRVPDYEDLYTRLGWKMLPTLDRVYDNTSARQRLGWQPKYDFPHQLHRLRNGEPWQSPLAQSIGAKGYHPEHRGKGYPFI